MGEIFLFVLALGVTVPPVFVLTRADPAKQARIRARLSKGGLTDVRFLRALYGSDPADSKDECFTNRSVAHVQCDELRHDLLKRLGQFCSFSTRVFPAVIAEGRDSLILEDDVQLGPTVSDFRALLPKVLAELQRRRELTRVDAPSPISQIGQTHSAFATGSLSKVRRGPARHIAPDGRRATYRADDGWDVAYLGSCFSETHKLTYCEAVGRSSDRSSRRDAPLWITDGGRALCAHGMLLTPDGARLMREAQIAHFDEHWLKRSHLRQHDTSRPCTPDNLPYVPIPNGSLALKWPHADRVTNDYAVGVAADAGWLRSLSVWPQLVQQAASTRPEHKYKHYLYKHRLPRICGPSASLPIRAQARLLSAHVQPHHGKGWATTLRVRAKPAPAAGFAWLVVPL
jgi:hypothetical protein